MHGVVIASALAQGGFIVGVLAQDESTPAYMHQAESSRVYNHQAGSSPVRSTRRKDVRQMAIGKWQMAIGECSVQQQNQ